MLDRTGALGRYSQLVKNIGRAALSSFYPDDFEFYLCAFELVNSSSTEGYFVFPIQPSAIQKIEPNRTNIKKSLSGITVLTNSSFVPQEINIKGNFGKRFKILSSLDGVAFSKQEGFKRIDELIKPTFSTSIKTGYGAVKVLKSILDASRVVDKQGKPKKLFFYNLGFGESYLITIPPSGITFSQSEEQNMIWFYQINMTIVSPLSSVVETDVESSSTLLLTKGVIQSGINLVANSIRTLSI